MTTRFDINVQTVYEHPTGNILLNFGSEVLPPDLLRSAINHKRAGHHIIYCDFGAATKSVQLFNSQWLSPFTTHVWGTIVLLTLILLSFSATIKIDGIRVSPSTWSFSILAIYFRQDVSIRHRLLLLTSLLLIPVLVCYEYDIAAQLIVPERRSQFTGLKELLEHGFEIYGTQHLPGSPPLKELIRFDFALLGQSGKLNSTVFETEGYTPVNLFGMVNPSTPNRSIIVATESIEFFLDHVQHRVLGGRFSCFAIKNVAIMKDFLDVLMFRFEKETQIMVGRIEAAGLTSIWKQWYDLFYKLMLHKDTTDRNRKWIGMIYLTSVIFMCGILWTCSTVIFIIEILLHRNYSLNTVPVNLYIS